MLERLFQGHIVMVNGPPLQNTALSRCELSFPVLSGFSGAPLYGNVPIAPFQQDNWRIMGMVYGNFESTILTYADKSYSEDGSEYKESMYRILELGLAHSAKDLLILLKNLDVPDIAVTVEKVG